MPPMTEIVSEFKKLKSEKKLEVHSVQGVSFKNLILQMADALFQCIFDPTIVKPKCV